MIKYFVCFFALVFAVDCCAQMTSGLTGKGDTSYTTYSAYMSSRKKYPDIKIVPEQQFANVSEKRDIAYCNTGTRHLLLDAFYPKKGVKKLIPAILIVHGGGWRSGNRAQHIPLAQHLAALGYACFIPEYRLSTEALYPAPIYDLKAALRWLHANAKAFKIDTNKIAILGFSAGGELAAFIGSINQDKQYEGDLTCNPQHQSQVQAVVDIDGTLSFVHPESGEGDDSKNISAATYWFGYSKKDKPELWKEASPLTHVSKQMPPIVFINSSVDRMHAGREDFIKVLNENHIYSEVHAFPDAPHSFCLFDPWFEPTVKYIDGFLKKVFILGSGQ